MLGLVGVGMNPHCKGVGMVATVDAMLGNRARFEPHLRPELRRHLDHRPSAARWYPADELIGLLDALHAGDPFPNTTRRGAYELYGAIAVRRDVNADQAVVPEKRRSALAGAYEGALNLRTDLAVTLRRLPTIWQLYWDEGEHVADRLDERTLRIRMVGCAPTAPEVCWLHTGFYRGAFEVLGIGAEIEHTTCTAEGAPQCTWQLRLDVSPDALATAFPG